MHNNKIRNQIFIFKKKSHFLKKDKEEVLTLRASKWCVTPLYRFVNNCNFIKF